ncbi:MULTISPECIES: diaminopimelate dehydrogenase [Carnobacterium]|uniref:Meso-diaminopimelate D-dehydrogenase n=1 Tax=Carnobacterium antarcticum TaxID=2126436 RepID=A0ABW4NPR3_9LACT|nr:MULTISPECIES: diaminopimelate dehydrogenase [unclassified Carnobacterium]ALV21247.1 Meso-diaminopimelate D-dehydrogenase [Carnobacterium sp. CP1]QQP69273.1 diaminopimelate dehydrogenase [Carnobacterium sp. CS13]
MTNKIRIGLVGYGNIGKGVELALEEFPDMEGIAVFTRRNPEDLDSKLKAISLDHILDYQEDLDVLILCGGSATDLPGQGPALAKHFSTIDSYDNHNQIPEYFETMDQSAKAGKNISIISVGWDPGLFSLNRAVFESILPAGETYTFWGKGLSQGHSDAIRRIDGVKFGVQYTIPVETALEEVRSGSNPTLSTREKHKRVCYVVAEAGSDQNLIEETIKTMPDYFEPYDTTVHFIDEKTFKEEHQKMPHGGFVIRTATSATGNKQKAEFQLELESNAEFTSSILVAYARAAYKFKKDGKSGALSVLDVPPAYLSPKSAAQLRKELL